MSVKRFYAYTFDGKAKECVKASDYDALVSVCRAVVRNCFTCHGNGHYDRMNSAGEIEKRSCSICQCALALLDGEKNEGVRA